MSEWQLEWSPSVLKELRKLPAEDRRRIGAALQRLVTGSQVTDCKKLEGDPPQWRLRVGDWRVLFRRHGTVIRVMKIFNRQAGY